jgi:hypothetical protein
MIKSNNIRIILLLLVLNGSFHLNFLSQEVNLEISGKREIEPFYRISRQAKLIDTIIPVSEIQYPLLSLKYKTVFGLDTIKTAKIKLVDKMSELKKGYVKIGIGSALMPLFEGYYNSERSRKSLYGIHLKHLSSFGKIKDYAPAQMDRSSVMLYGKLTENKYDSDVKLNFKSKGLHHYGIKNENIRQDSIAQRFSDVGILLNFKKHKKDSLTLNYELGLEYNYFQDKKRNVDSTNKWNGRENYIALKSLFWYKLGKETIYLDASSQFNGFQYGVSNKKINAYDSAIVNNNFIFRLNPYITTFAKNNRLKVKFGVSFAYDVRSDNVQPLSKAFLYPDIEVKYSLFDDILIPYLIINGGLKQNTFKSLSTDNEFIRSNNSIWNENNVIKNKIGIKGALSNTILFNASVSYGITKNKALFISDTLLSNLNRFTVIYDQVNTFEIEASLIYQLDEKIKMEGIGMFYSNETKINSFAWNLPQLQVIARINYQILPQLNVNFDFNIESGRRTFVYNLLESDHVENLQYSKKLGLIADFNLGAEYFYSKNLTAFLQFNNFAAQRYNRWYNYPVMGFQVLGGISFKF